MFHVKHSIIEPEPAGARDVCGEALDALRDMADHIATWGEELGLVGPRELDRLWSRHILNSGLLALKVPPGSLADVGSGAGFPGLVVAVMRPDVQCTLIEPLGRRATWLEEEAVRLGLTNVTVLNQRAEELVGDITVDCVTARAVSALKTLIPLCVPLLRRGGELLLMKGQKVDEEIRSAASVMVEVHLVNPRVEITGPEYGTEETRIFRATVGG
jgi:16S rRNA (guanine527-N7)-methyltransferase